MNKLPLYAFRPQGDKDFPFEIFTLEEHPKLSQLAQKPRRDRFYALLWVTAADGVYTIDFHEYPFQPNTLVLVAPGQVHYWESMSRVRGYAIPFTEELFHTFDGDDFLKKLSISTLPGAAFIAKFKDDRAQEMDHIFAQLYDEDKNAHFGRTEMIVSLLKIILVFAQREISATQTGSPASAPQNLVHGYLSLLNEDVNAQYRLADFADQLGVTAGYLTETVKEATGIPAGALLRQRLVLEVKRFLAHTDLTSAQVAEKLNFKDPAYFNRFFKRETGKTPGAFREEIRKIR